MEFEPALLDFGDVPVGFEATRSALLRNRTTHPVTLTQLRITSGAYALSTLPTLPPATVGTDALGNRTVTPSEAPLTVSFRPLVAGPQGSLLIATAPFDVQPTVSLTLRGEGGGRDIEVSPASLALGRVGFFGTSGAQLTRQLTIANVGARAQPPDAARNLLLGDGAMRAERCGPSTRSPMRSSFSRSSRLEWGTR